MLDGHYDEQANAAEFQAALADWRAGKRSGSGDSPRNASSTLSPRTSQSGTGREGAAVDDDRKRASFHRTPSDDRLPSVEDQKRTSVDKPTDSHRYHVDVKGTSTTEDAAKPLKIEFHSNISYADKLLLKKHRRDPVDVLPKPENLQSFSPGSSAVCGSEYESDETGELSVTLA